MVVPVQLTHWFFLPQEQVLRQVSIAIVKRCWSGSFWHQGSFLFYFSTASRIRLSITFPFILLANGKGSGNVSQRVVHGRLTFRLFCQLSSIFSPCDAPLVYTHVVDTIHSEEHQKYIFWMGKKLATPIAVFSLTRYLFAYWKTDEYVPSSPTLLDDRVLYRWDLVLHEDENFR